MPQVGGPRYAPRVVNKAAFRVLDALFPMGALSRRAVSLLFRLWLHPGVCDAAVCLPSSTLARCVLSPRMRAVVLLEHKALCGTMLHGMRQRAGP